MRARGALQVDFRMSMDQRLGHLPPGERENARAAFAKARALEKAGAP